MPKRVIAVASQKGGVGKTTTAVNMAAELQRLGHSTLLVDLDSQAHATMHLGIVPDNLDYTVYDVLHNPTRGGGFALVRMPPLFNRPDLLPANIELAGADIDLANKVARETLLRQALAPLLASYEFIILDTPPNLGLLTLNALGMATEVLVPVATEYLPMKGLALIQNTITLMQSVNPALHLAGILCTQVDLRRNLDKAVLADLRQSFGPLVYETTIPIDVKLAEAPAAGQTIFEYAPESRGARAYEALTMEVYNGKG